MSKLYFIHSTMNTGKSALLLMKAHSFLENGIEILCIKPSVDTRDGDNVIKSRIGIEMACLTIGQEDNIYDIITNYCLRLEGTCTPLPQWILCDESQFFTAEHVDQLARIVDCMNIDVICYGLRTDFTGHLFEGSKRLFELADNIEEVKLSCSCGRKAIINARVDSFGNVLTEGEQVQIGGNEMYKPMCRKCYFERINGYYNNIANYHSKFNDVME